MSEPVIMETTADHVRGHDYIVAHDGETLPVFDVRRDGEAVVLSVGTGTYTVPADYLLRIVAEVQCWDCAGRGIWYGRGYVENGTFRGQTGRCFRCGGKGRQTRQDMARNRTYDNHIRRV